jgi:hypothetical protein
VVTGINSALDFLGTRLAAALACGGILLLLGFIGLALALASARQAPAAPGRLRHSLLIIVSAFLSVIGGLALLGVGIIYPLRAMQVRSRVLVSELTRVQSEQLALAILSQPKYRDPKKLNRYAFKMFSQHGEDGILAEIFRRIGTTNRYFVEFGSSDGAENNTVFLFRQGWSGFWIDADTAAINTARERFHSEIAGKKLTVTEAFITAENIEDLFRQAQVPEEFDLLSVDIDRNDYHVWEKIAHYRPRAVVIEYNAGVPPTMSLVVPYEPMSGERAPFGNGNGASLKALEELGARKGYSLVACDLCGVNAFFVRNDLLGSHFLAPYTADNHYEPFRGEYLGYHHYGRETLEPEP